MSALSKNFITRVGTPLALAAGLAGCTTGGTGSDYNWQNATRPAGGICIPVSGTTPNGASLATDVAQAVAFEIKVDKKINDGRWLRQTGAMRDTIEAAGLSITGTIRTKYSDAACAELANDIPNGGAVFINGKANDVRGQNGTWWGVSHSLTQ